MQLLSWRRWRYFDAVLLRYACGREITSRIEDEVISEERVAFNEACQYPDGTRVMSSTTLEVKEGKIKRQVSIEAWDE